MISGSDFTEPRPVPPDRQHARSTSVIAPGAGRGRCREDQLRPHPGRRRRGFPASPTTASEARGLEILNDVPVPGGAPDMAPVRRGGARPTAPTADHRPAGCRRDGVHQGAQEGRSRSPSACSARSGRRCSTRSGRLGRHHRGSVLPAAGLRQRATRVTSAPWPTPGSPRPRGYRITSTPPFAFAEAANEVPTSPTPTCGRACRRSRDLDFGLTPPVQWAEGGVAGTRSGLLVLRLHHCSRGRQPVPGVRHLQGRVHRSRTAPPPRD